MGFLVRNALIELDGKEYLLFRKRAGSIWQLENTKDHSFIEREEASLYRSLAKRNLRFIPLTVLPGAVNKIELTPAEQAFIKNRRKYVLAVAHIPNTKSQMEPVINEVWDEIKAPERRPSWTTVYRWKVAYYRANGDARALLDRKTGRAWRVEIYGPIVIGICEDAIDKIYMRRERGATIEATLDRAKHRVKAAQRLLDAEYRNSPASSPNPKPLEEPTRKLIRRLIGEIDEFDKYAARHSHPAAMVIWITTPAANDI